MHTDSKVPAAGGQATQKVNGPTVENIRVYLCSSVVPFPQLPDLDSLMALRNHAFAKVHIRSAVRSGKLSASAASGMLRPAK
jgi:hypothetical protein